jgi:glucokinase
MKAPNMAQNNLLFGDIGGTNARVAFGHFNQNQLIIEKIKIYKSADHKQFEDILSLFMAEHAIDVKTISGVCFAAAGPVKQGEVKFTNLSWNLSETKIRKHLGIPHALLLNDFAAAGYGIHTLVAEDVVTFNGPSNQANTEIKSIIGAGTGLGMAHISYNNGQPVIHASEGGHVDFAPVGQTQQKLFNYLKTKLHRVSVERVLSGYGVKNIYEFLRDTIYTNTDDYALLEKQIKETATSAATVILDNTPNFAIAKHCQDLFLEIYAQAISNLALTTLPFGGLYVAGGIAPKLKDYFNETSFKNHLFDKGRMSGLIQEIPMHIILDTTTGLKGAGYVAHYNFKIS